MRAAHSNLQRQNTVYSYKKYVTLQHLLLMQLIVDTTWAEDAKHEESHASYTQRSCVRISSH